MFIARRLKSLVFMAFVVFVETAFPQEAKKVSYNIFPILNYDSDIGFGIGTKGLVRNYFQNDESFDLTLYASSKGERWALFTFAIPDFELRQAKAFPWAVDLRVELDKQVKTNFMGFGNDSEDNDFQFPRKFFKLDLAMSRAITPRFIVSLNSRYAHYHAYGFDPAWGTITSLTPGAGKSQVAMQSVAVLFDARDSQLQPTKGVLVKAEASTAHRIFGGDWRFTRFQLRVNCYQRLFSKSHILALRHWIQDVDGSAPYLEQGRLGNSWTLRGYKAERFIDKALALASAEYRFLIWKKLGGVAFADAGRVWNSIRDYGFSDWHGNRGIGLRYYLTTFVARLDIGKSSEGTRIFFNFGHVF